MSRFNDVNWEVFRSNKNYESYSADKKLFRIQESTFCDHSICLYRNSFCFNDINWNIFDVAEDYDTHIHHSTVSISLIPHTNRKEKLHTLIGNFEF